MKNVIGLSEILDSLGLSEQRKIDILAKYILADKKLEYKMNEYFKIYPNKRNQKSFAKLCPQVKPESNLATDKRRSNINLSKIESYGGYARWFDNREKPQTDPSYLIDKSLDEDFFKNNK